MVHIMRNANFAFKCARAKAKDYSREAVTMFKITRQAEVVEKLKSILNELNIKYSKILLFGSRARGDFREESDWDFLIILKKPLDAKTKKEL